jgi:predicted enzyme related to lactoylglutathione lyase
MNALNWFEIPARDIARAQAFYEQLLGAALRREDMGPERALAVFPYTEPGVGGCLMSGPGLAPAAAGASGALIYLAASPTLDAVLARLPACGGRLVTPKVTLPDGMGVFAHIEDSEGNVVGLHAQT